MKTIGLLGGMSWESTAEYYRLANELVRDQLGGLHSAKILMHSVDFAEIEAMQVEGRWDDAGALLADAAERLQRAGAELIVLCTNTMHKVAAPIEAAVSVPFIHLGDTTAEAVKAAGITKVGLLGTIFTMEQDFYVDRLSGHGLDVVLPGPEDRKRVSEIIYDELCLGVVRDESRAFYLEAIQRLRADGAEGVILGCTEIELLIDQSHVELPVFPTTALHVQAAVRLALT
ncbi:aspartate/glutamate racemase family protein [Aeromicrobium sp.]|uniref:aspartate/glutamate racemase family protein n=1 Tax=Aeromicrobium sp. TaxID=1871063 RepID=UPI002FC6A34D